MINTTFYMILVEKFNINHLGYIQNVLNERKLPIILANDLPKLGVITTLEGKFIGAGFIREIEGNSGVLDSYITNPEMHPNIRDKALDLITEELINLAKLNNMESLLAISNVENIISRAIRHDFIKTEYTLLSRKLI